jgi:hypothetical protein
MGSEAFRAGDGEEEDDHATKRELKEFQETLRKNRNTIVLLGSLLVFLFGIVIYLIATM